MCEESVPGLNDQVHTGPGELERTDGTQTLIPAKSGTSPVQSCWIPATDYNPPGVTFFRGNDAKLLASAIA